MPFILPNEGFIYGDAGMSGAGGFLAGATLDMDFASSRYFGATPADLTTVRASAGMAQDTGGTWYSFANNIPRITNKGLLVEEARTNSLRNSSMAGIVSGTPGTLPNNWSGTIPTGMSRDIVGFGTEDGLPYMDVRLYGSSVGASEMLVNFEDSVQIVAATSQVWSASVFTRIKSGSIPGTYSFSLRIGGQDAIGTFLEQFVVASPPTSGDGNLGGGRSSGTATLANAGTLRTRSWLRLGIPAGSVPIDVTIRIGLPQLELGAFATSPILTAGAAATRAADRITSTAIAALVSFAPYSVFMDDEVNATNLSEVGAKIFVSWSAAAGFAESTYMNYSSAGMSVSVVAGGAGTGGANVGLLPTNKYAAAVAVNDSRAAAAGVLGSLDSAVTPSSASPISAFAFGSASWSPSNYMNGYIKRFAYFPTRLPDAQLQALTA